MSIGYFLTLDRESVWWETHCCSDEEFFMIPVKTITLFLWAGRVSRHFFLKLACRVCPALNHVVHVADQNYWFCVLTVSLVFLLGVTFYRTFVPCCGWLTDCCVERCRSWVCYQVGITVPRWIQCGAQELCSVSPAWRTGTQELKS